MKNGYFMFLAVFATTLTGCANLQQLDSTLAQIKNQAMVGNQGTGMGATVPVGQLGDGTGYQPQFNIGVPTNACNQQAYIDGFKDQYVMDWDAFITQHENTPFYGLPGRQEEVALAKFYQGHFIGMKNFRRHSSEAMPDVTGTNRAQACIYASYLAGKTNGGHAAITAEQQLVEPGQ